MGTFIFHLYVIRILVVSRKYVKCGEVPPTSEDVARRCLFGVGKKVELFLVDAATRGEWRSAG